MKKKILILSLGLLTATITIGCSQESQDRVGMPFIDYICKYDNFEIIENDGDIAEIRNKETGVHYYYYSSNNYRLAMTPVYEADGTVRVSK